MKELFQETKKEKENQKKHVGSSLLGINGTFLLQDGVDLDWKTWFFAKFSQSECLSSVCRTRRGWKYSHGNALHIPKASNWCI